MFKSRYKAIYREVSVEDESALCVGFNLVPTDAVQRESLMSHLNNARHTTPQLLWSVHIDYSTVPT